MNIESFLHVWLSRAPSGSELLAFDFEHRARPLSESGKPAVKNSDTLNPTAESVRAAG